MYNTGKPHLRSLRIDYGHISNHSNDKLPNIYNGNVHAHSV